MDLQQPDSWCARALELGADGATAVADETMTDTLRDIAIIADTQVSAFALRQCVEKLSPLIRQVLIFDVYLGTGIENGKKSVALGLVLQDDDETLTDAKIDGVMAVVLARLAEEFNATLRV